jgi:iron complex transport system ATP-binding protein
LREHDLLSADNVSFRYDPRGPLVVDGVSLRIDAGGLVGIIGPNGSGKTTLLRLLSGTRLPSRGRVWLGSQAMNELSRREIARRIAVVPQATELAFEYTSLEIVLMGRHPHLGVFTVEGPEDVRIAMKSLGGPRPAPRGGGVV